MIKVLVACEYSGIVREAFKVQGHDVISCDFLETEIPGNHYKGDVRDILNDGFDLLIAHPPCTYLTISAEWAYKDEIPNKNIREGTLIGEARKLARIQALKFIDTLWSADITYKCIENPVGVIPRLRPNMPKPQYIQPYQFGEDASKKTGLWLDNLPQLTATVQCHPRVIEHRGKLVERYSNQTDSGQNNLPPSKDRWKIRSSTYPGIAKAIAEQYGEYVDYQLS